MATDNTTVNQGYELPHPKNTTAHDVERIIAALTAIDMDVATLVGGLLLKAALESPAFSGTPTAPTQPAGTNNNTLATTGHVQLALEAFLSEAAGALETIAALEAALGEGSLADELLTQLGLKAPLASPALTGVPTAPTAATDTSTTQIATTAFVQAVRDALIAGAPTGLNTLAKIAISLGGDDTFSASVAAALALKAPIASPAFTGNPTAPTQVVGNNSTRLATTAFVQAAINLFALTVTSDLANKAPLVSPALTGTPTAPTQALGNNTTRIATTAFVQAAVALRATLESPALTGTPRAPTAPSGTNTTQIATTAFVEAVKDAIETSLALKAGLASPALTGNPTAPTQPEGNNSTRIATTAFVTTAVQAIGAVAILQDRKSAGTDGGSAVATTWTTRALNSEFSDADGLVSLASNVFTPSDTCFCEFWSIFHRVGAAKCRLWNVTDGVEAAVGSTAAATTGAGASSHSIGSCLVAAGKQYRMEYYATNAQSANGLGFATGAGTEVYSQVVLRRI